MRLQMHAFLSPCSACFLSARVLNLLPLSSLLAPPRAPPRSSLPQTLLLSRRTSSWCCARWSVMRSKRTTLGKQGRCR